MNGSVPVPGLCFPCCDPQDNRLARVDRDFRYFLASNLVTAILVCQHLDDPCSTANRDLSETPPCRQNNPACCHQSSALHRSTPWLLRHVVEDVAHVLVCDGSS